MPDQVLTHLAIILVAGVIVGWICKRLNISLIIGYMIVGVVLSPNCLNLFSVENEEITTKALKNVKQCVLEKFGPDVPESKDIIIETPAEQKKNIDDAVIECIAQFGVLLLLFSIGVEFTLDKMAAMSKYMFVGGTLQILLTGGITACIGHFGMSWSWELSIIVAMVYALSSTALVFKSMQDEGVATSRRGKGTLGVLLFQDVALVPMLLFLPVLSGGESPTTLYWVDMALKTIIFCVVVVAGKVLMMRYLAAKLAKMRSKELLIALVLAILIGLCALAVLFGLTPALGALAAGIVMGENRLTSQIESLFVPFSESFSAMFFISLGMMMNLDIVIQNPRGCLIALLAMIIIKTIAGAGALWCCGFKPRSALGYALAMAQVGELAFMMLLGVYQNHMIEESAYYMILFASVMSMIITPYLVKLGVKIASPDKEVPVEVSTSSPIQQALEKGSLDKVIVIGAGHIGAHLAARLETMGKVVCVIDYSPINLYRFAQEGMATFVGDASSADLLIKAGIENATAVFITIPDDMIAMNIVRACHDLNPDCSILCRARFDLNVKPLQRAGAEMVVCEESNVCNALLKLVSGYN